MTSIKVSEKYTILGSTGAIFSPFSSVSSARIVSIENLSLYNVKIYLSSSISFKASKRETRISFSIIPDNKYSGNTNRCKNIIHRLAWISSY